MDYLWSFGLFWTKQDICKCYVRLLEAVMCFLDYFLTFKGQTINQ